MKPGDPITVLDPEIIRGVVTVGSFKMQGSILFRWERHLPNPNAAMSATPFNATLDEAQECVTWVKGWDGVDVDAMRAAEALK
jgi:hypothetical protein